MAKDKKIVPVKLAHIVLKTKQFEAMASWYGKVFHMEDVFKNDILNFMTFDEEHHRLVLINMPSEIGDHDPMRVGLGHYAFSYANLDDLLETYVRLKGQGIVPFFPINHGMTTSLYYKDPDGNEVELMIDNFSTPEESKAYFQTEAFSANPIGHPFDPDILSVGHKAGRPFAEVMAEAIAAASDIAIPSAVE
ncbi:biphenyl 2,3-dioxygenase [Pseudomaricurvus alcaniphilus]|uniref:VOC family protein n=1 Tax=Pseudomaricurvus alcaniphilus TaxID=1166482 RepID=UPI00140B41BB|nr:VOC family protein [Pseudomaricurvus alcaniphilus]NHN36522.1 biphenyl 2,3-dioxygenase [Pseudomaricurvus alcaniphilus]